MRPKFDSIYNGSWIFDFNDGVGLLLIGVPNDDQKFINDLMDFSCHPKAGQRIIDRLKENGSDRLTVMSRLDFDAVYIVMKNNGVEMKIINPQIGWESKYQDGDYPKAFILPHMR